MSTVIFQNKTANELVATEIHSDGSPIALRFVGTFSAAVIVAHISTSIGVSKVTLSVSDTEQSTELKLFTGESARLEITGSDVGTNISCIAP